MWSITCGWTPSKTSIEMRSPSSRPQANKSPQRLDRSTPRTSTMHTLFYHIPYTTDTHQPSQQSMGAAAARRTAGGGRGGGAAADGGDGAGGSRKGAVCWSVSINLRVRVLTNRLCAIPTPTSIKPGRGSRGGGDASSSPSKGGIGRSSSTTAAVTAAVRGPWWRPAMVSDTALAVRVSLWRGSGLGYRGLWSHPPCI